MARCRNSSKHRIIDPQGETGPGTADVHTGRGTNTSSQRQQRSGPRAAVYICLRSRAKPSLWSCSTSRNLCYGQDGWASKASWYGRVTSCTVYRRCATPAINVTIPILQIYHLHAIDCRLLSLRPPFSKCLPTFPNRPLPADSRRLLPLHQPGGTRRSPCRGFSTVLHATRTAILVAIYVGNLTHT